MAKGTNPVESKNAGDLAESGVKHVVEGVDESAHSDTSVMEEGCGIPIGSALCTVVCTDTLPIAGGGTVLAVDVGWSSDVGVDKAMANSVVACDLVSTDVTVLKHGL